MGIVGSFMLVMIIIIAVALSWNYIQGFVFEIITEGNKSFTQIQTSNKIKTTAQPDELICDLAITTQVLVDNIRVKGSVNPPTAKAYVWSDCNPTSAIPLASLLDFSFDGLLSLMELNVFTEGIGDQQLQTVIRLQDRETGEIRDRFTDPNLEMNQPASLGLFDTGGKVFSEDFFIKNIPSRDYDLEIFYTTCFESIEGCGGRDIPINDGAIGAPVKERICAVGKTSC